jgi:hypothetical protein
MSPAALPGRARQRGADRLDQPAVRVGGDQRDAGQAAGGQAAEERQPPGAVLSTGDLQAQDLPVTTGVHPHCEQGMDVDDPAALADFEHQGIGSDERIRPGVQRPGPEVLRHRVELGGHHADLRLAQPRDSQGLRQLFHPPRGDTEQIAGRRR